MTTLIKTWGRVEGDWCGYCDGGKCPACGGRGGWEDPEDNDLWIDCDTCDNLNCVCPTCGGSERTTWFDARLVDGSRFWCMLTMQELRDLYESDQLPEWLTDEHIRNFQASRSGIPAFFPKA